MTSHQATIGTRAQVMHGTAQKTSGGLRKKDLVRKNGRIVPKSKSSDAKKRWAKMMKDPEFRAKWNKNKKA